MKKKLLGIVLSAALALSALMVPQTEARASEFEILKVTAGKSDTECNNNAVVNRTAIIVPDDKAKQNIYYFQFTLKQDSIVHFAVNTDAAAGSDYTKIVSHYTIYSDKIMSQKIWKKDNSIDGLRNDSMTQSLAKGTYYCQLRVSPYGSFFGDPEGSGEHEIRTVVQAVPLTSAAALKYSVKGNNVSMSVKNNVSIWLPRMWQALSNRSSVSLGADYRRESGEVVVRTKKDIVKTGNHLFVCLAEEVSDYGFAHGDKANISLPVDVQAPTVECVYNNKTHKSAKISFSDKSGIKSAKLNGKSVKSGTSVTKRGSYKLTVTDKHGNSKTVKFRVK